MLNYKINRTAEDDNYATYIVCVPKDTSNGRGHVTRSTNDLVVATYTRFEVEMNGGVPSIVERTANYTVEKNITDEEVAANLRKMFGDAVRIDSIERYSGTIVGIPVEVFQALGRPIERPESQRK